MIKSTVVDNPGPGNADTVDVTSNGGGVNISKYKRDGAPAIQQEMKPGPKKYDRIPGDAGLQPGPSNYAHEHV